MAGCGASSAGEAFAAKVLCECFPTVVEVQAPAAISGDRASAARKFRRAVVTVSFTRCQFRSGRSAKSSQFAAATSRGSAEACGQRAFEEGRAKAGLDFR